METGNGQYRFEEKEMVFVEEKSDYLQKIEEENDLFFLKEYLWQKSVIPITDESKTVHKLIFALVQNDVAPLKEIIEDYSNREPNSQSSYINNDLIIFLFVCIVQKFNLQQQWLINFVEQRKSEEEEKKSITRTFQNLLNENLASKDNYFEIVIIYKEIIGKVETNQHLLNETYEKLSKQSFPFYDSQFLNLISLRAVDLIILWKGLDDYNEFKNLKNFSQVFDDRVKKISNFISWFCIAFFLGLTGYFSYKLFFGTQAEKNLFSQIFSVLGAIGVSVVGVGRKKVEEFFNNVLKKLFGRIT